MFEKADSTSPLPSNPATPSASETVSPTSPNPTTPLTDAQGNTIPQEPPNLKGEPTVSPSSNDSIGNKPTPKTKRAQRPKNAGFVKTGSAKPPLEAMRTMSDFTDYVAGSLRLKGEEASSMEQEAADLYDQYVGGKPPLTLKGLANTFGRLLEKNGFKPGEQARDEFGRFKK